MQRRRTYFWLMGTCIALILVAWNVVRFFSIPLAIAMSIVAAVIPPAAAIAANLKPDDLRQFRRDRDER